MRLSYKILVGTSVVAAAYVIGKLDLLPFHKPHRTESTQYAYEVLSEYVSHPLPPEGFIASAWFRLRPTGHYIAIITRESIPTGDYYASLSTAQQERISLESELSSISDSIRIVSDRIRSLQYELPQHNKVIDQNASRLAKQAEAQQQTTALEEELQRQTDEIAGLRDQHARTTQEFQKQLRRGTLTINGARIRLGGNPEQTRTELRRLEIQIQKAEQHKATLTRKLDGLRSEVHRLSSLATSNDAAIRDRDETQRAVFAYQEQVTILERRQRTASDSILALDNHIAELREKVDGIEATNAQRLQGVAVYGPDSHLINVYENALSGEWEQINVFNLDADDDAEFVLFSGKKTSSEQQVTLFDVCSPLAKGVVHSFRYDKRTSTVDICDVNNDRSKEIVISKPSSSNLSMTVFKWTGATLQSVDNSSTRELLSKISEKTSHAQQILLGTESETSSRNDKKERLQHLISELPEGQRELVIGNVLVPSGEQLVPLGSYMRYSGYSGGEENRNYALYTPEAQAFGAAVDLVLDQFDPLRLRRSLPSPSYDPERDYVTDATGSRTKIWTQANPWGWKQRQDGRWENVVAPSWVGTADAYQRQTGRRPSSFEIEQMKRLGSSYTIRESEIPDVRPQQGSSFQSNHQTEQIQQMQRDVQQRAQTAAQGAAQGIQRAAEAIRKAAEGKKK